MNTNMNLVVTFTNKNINRRADESILRQHSWALGCLESRFASILDDVQKNNPNLYEHLLEKYEW